MEAKTVQRYARQAAFAGIGTAGQAKLATSRVLVVGCGALGTHSANLLVRAGVGFVRIVDRDYVEFHNLQRQVLFDESHAHDGLPKAEAAARALRAINSEVTIEPHIAEVGPHTIEAFMHDVDVVVDGTDNFETRFVVNDAAVKLSKPWVYGGSIGSEGMVMTIIPRSTACLRCVFESPPPAGSVATCETAGILGSTVAIVAGLQVAETLKLLVGDVSSVRSGLLSLDVWQGTFRTVATQSVLASSNCKACKQHDYEFLNASGAALTTALCGRNAVHVAPRFPTQLALEELAARLAVIGVVKRTRFLVKCDVGEYGFTIFADGRAIIAGTDDPVRARSLYAQYIGS